MFKKIFISVLGLLFFWSVAMLLPNVSKAENTSKIYFFYGQGCPHCGEVEEFFNENDLYSKYPVEKKEIYFNRENAVLFNKLMDDLGILSQYRGVPAVVIGNKALIGDTPIITSFITETDKFLKSENVESNNKQMDKSTGKKTDLTLAAVIVGSLVDAINPCEFAVLIILMTTILATGNSRKALWAGLAFATSIFISYFLMGLGLYQALSLGNASDWFFKIVGWLAIALGILNIKDFFWYGKGFLMEVPLSWRPRLKGLINSVTSPRGAFLIGFLVSIFLLPCTSGPYIVILGMLAKRVLDVRAIAYLLIYNLIFVSPMLIISWAVYKGFDPKTAETIRQKQLKTLHLIAGVVLLAMGGVILLGWV